MVREYLSNSVLGWGSREVSGSSALTSEHACAHKPLFILSGTGKTPFPGPSQSVTQCTCALSEPPARPASPLPHAPLLQAKKSVSPLPRHPCAYPQPCMNPPALYHSKLYLPLGPTWLVGELWDCLPPDEAAEYYLLWSVFRIPTSFLDGALDVGPLVLLRGTFRDASIIGNMTAARRRPLIPSHTMMRSAPVVHTEISAPVKFHGSL